MTSPGSPRCLDPRLCSWSRNSNGQPLGGWPLRLSLRTRERTSGEKGSDARRREHRSEAYAAYAAARSAAPTTQLAPYRRLVAQKQRGPALRLAQLFRAFDLPRVELTDRGQGLAAGLDRLGGDEDDGKHARLGT